jgi:hypothetical protein
LKKRVNPPPLEPVKVEGWFEPTLIEASSCAWVTEVGVYDYEQKNCTYYPHPKNGAKCYREAWVGPQKYHEFLMVSPDGKKKSATQQ